MFEQGIGVCQKLVKTHKLDIAHIMPLAQGLSPGPARPRPTQAQAQPWALGPSPAQHITTANCIFLEAHGNYNPNIKRTSLETSKAQFQIVSPDNHLEFDADFNQAITHIEAIQKKAINNGPH